MADSYLDQLRDEIAMENTYRSPIAPPRTPFVDDLDEQQYRFHVESAQSMPKPGIWERLRLWWESEYD